MEKDESHREIATRNRPSSDDIRGAAAAIAAEIARRSPAPEHPLGCYQTVVSADHRCIWIASAVGPCMDIRFTPLEIHPEYTLTRNCVGPKGNAHKVGWRSGTPEEIVDLLVAVVDDG